MVQLELHVEQPPAGGYEQNQSNLKDEVILGNSRNKETPGYTLEFVGPNADHAMQHVIGTVQLEVGYADDTMVDQNGHVHVQYTPKYDEVPIDEFEGRSAHTPESLEKIVLQPTEDDFGSTLGISHKYFSDYPNEEVEWPDHYTLQARALDDDGNIITNLAGDRVESNEFLIDGPQPYTNQDAKADYQRWRQQHQDEIDWVRNRL